MEVQAARHNGLNEYCKMKPTTDAEIELSSKLEISIVPNGAVILYPDGETFISFIATFNKIQIIFMNSRNNFINI